MTTGKTTSFEELTKLAIDFVTTKKGLWDHAAWMDFVSGLQAKGFDLSGDMQTNLGNLLEAIKRFYTAAAATESVERAVKTVVSDSVTFVKRHKGVWGHSEWEDFVETVERNTLNLSEGTMAYLGRILESIKIFYALSPVGRVQKRLSTPPAEPSFTSKPTLAAAEKMETKPAAAKPPEGTKVTPKAPPKRDDLTAIDGIGPTLANKLNAAGIFSYAQLAALSDDDIERLERDIIRFSGRIKRDDWVGQAKKLAQGR